MFQKIIRELYKREKEYKSNQLTLTEENVLTDSVVYEITSDGVYQVDHPAALAAAGLDKPKRKRGRPPKKTKANLEKAQEALRQQELLKAETMEEPSGKRRRKTPTRFKEAVQGKELERIFKEEGVIDGEESDRESKPETKPEPYVPPRKEPEVIGHRQDSGELVVVVKGKGRGRPKGRMHPKRQECAICGMEFNCVGRYMSHIAQHGPVNYQCQQCGLTFETRLLFTEHQESTQHSGQVIIPVDPPVDTQAEEQTDAPPDPLDITAASTDPTAGPDETNVCPSLPDLNAEPIEAASQLGQPLAIDDKALDNPLIVNDVPEKTEGDEDKTKKGKQKLKCPHCDKMFSNKQSKSMHIKATHQGERPYTCGECGAKFAYPRSLSLHTLSHRRQRPQAKGYACDLCGKVLNHPSSVVYHKEAEHAGMCYVCNKCGKSFKHKQLLQRHQLVHSQHRPFNCKICNSSFKTKANLINHQLLHSGVKKFSCEICKHKFAHKTSLTLHMRWHTGSKPYSCGECGKSFSQKGNLSEHERIHTGEKPYACTLCGRRFTTSSQHRLHARRHAAERPFACNLCGKRFLSRSSYAAHMRREAGARTHRCAVCPRAFTERWALLKHMRRHTGERPFKCPHCPRAFADCSNLNKHKKQVHKQISLLAPERTAQVPTPAPVPAPAPAAAEDDSDSERVIYVAYDVDDDEPAYTIIDADQALELQSGALVPGALAAPILAPQEHMPVTDEQGNPLHFTMQDGTRLAITSADGKSLQVITQDGQTIPVEINGYADAEEMENPDTIVHQLNLQKSVEVNTAEPVTHYYTIV
ncbi:hypothetical protein ABMA27_013588 [Loxostege sticticalis]|uniref:C2H2-type domain-containing protein n=1 Tax=Loxostege sticticalis TaxID=481309 RepID=A0ABR3IFT6_LOXSC